VATTLPPPFDTYVPGFLIENRYEVIAILGHGGQGIVFSVFDHRLREESALKVLLDVAGAEIWREASLLTKLSGKFLLPVRNADFASGRPFVVTEIARHGTTSDEMLQDVGVPTARAVQWALHASRGASRMHDHGLVHNDLKPENLFLNANGEALLGDLGFASELNGSGFAELRGGTPFTMPPEVATAFLTHLAGGSPGTPCSVASDVYALGATLYWLLAGRAPYRGDGTLSDLLTEVAAGPPPSLATIAPHVPRGICDAVSKAMSRTAVDRYPTAAAFDYALARVALPNRKWSRRPPHAGHQTCFEGVKGKSTMAVCASQLGTNSQLSIAITHQPSGRQAEPARTATQAQLPQRLRAIFRNYK